MQLRSSWLFCEVIGNLCLEKSQFEPIEYKFPFLTILVILFEIVRKRDVSKAPDILSSRAVRLFKKNFVVF